MNCFRTYLTAAVLVIGMCIPGVSNAQESAHGLGLRTVVIDPGHGGKDPGALGKNRDMHEKHIVLAVAKKFGDRIKAAYPDVRVVYTREGDTFMGLHERAMVARRNNADLFISIHCNGSSSPDAKGTSVHILGQSSDNKKNKTDYFERNMSVAQRENAVIVLEDGYETKYQSFDSSSPESFISHQLQWMAYYESSLLFASEVVSNLIQEPLVPRRMVIDQDIFQVLVEANMPAILLELAFVSNPAEYRYLSSPNGQTEIADRLFEAFKAYKTKFDSSVDVEQPTYRPQPAAAPAVVDQPAAHRQSSGYYSIQIMALGRALRPGAAEFKGLPAERFQNQGTSIYKYVVGRYTSIDEARYKLQDIKKKFPDAFLVRISGTEVQKVK